MNSLRRGMRFKVVASASVAGWMFRWLKYPYSSSLCKKNKAVVDNSPMFVE